VAEHAIASRTPVLKSTKSVALAQTIFRTLSKTDQEAKMRFKYQGVS
jgi:hypothetical protein